MHKFDRSLIPSQPTLEFERALWAQGIGFVAGVDEAGRGALAGPVSAAAVILPCGVWLETMLAGVRDSKTMTARQRSLWAERLACAAISSAVGFASAAEIDQVGIVPATRLAVQRAVDDLCLAPQHLLVDYLPLPEIPLPQTNLVKGDARCLSIAAASVLAKTARDALMGEMEALYPGYGFAQHKGYGTQQHRRAIAALGPSPIHRRSFTLLEESHLNPVAAPEDKYG